MLPAWLGSAEALKHSSKGKFKKILVEMEKDWPFFNSTMDILDMVISKADPEISKIYEENLADNKLKSVGKNLRYQFHNIKKLNREITPKEIIKAKKAVEGPKTVGKIDLSPKKPVKKDAKPKEVTADKKAEVETPATQTPDSTPEVVADKKEFQSQLQNPHPPPSKPIMQN